MILWFDQIGIEALISDQFKDFVRKVDWWLKSLILELTIHWESVPSRLDLDYSRIGKWNLM